jgi:hypothetical protein
MKSIVSDLLSDNDICHNRSLKGNGGRDGWQREGVMATKVVFCPCNSVLS